MREESFRLTPRRPHSQRSNGKRIRAYLCPHCHQWHATTELAPSGTLRKTFGR